MAEANRPAPSVVFEIASDGTWQTDKDYKLGRYAQMGVSEYFVYDPTRKPLWSGGRLIGWQYDNHQQPHPLKANARGWLWSSELKLWLADNRPGLSLYHSNEQAVLGQAEEEFIIRLVAEQREASERAAKEAERHIRIEAERREASERAAKEAEQQARIAAEQREAAERAAKEAEQQAMAALVAKLRARGIDPDSL